MRITCMVLALAVGRIAALSVEQTPAGQKPAFEVISIKRNASGQRGNSISVEGGRFIANNATLAYLVTSTYLSADRKGFLPSQIVGLPSWANIDHFDILAKPEGEARNVPVEEMRAMADAMLQDRFQLKSHREMREEQIYVLTVSKPGRIKPSADQTPPAPSGPPAFLDPNKPPRGRPVNVVSNRVFSTVAIAVPITTLVNMIQGQVGHPVVDKTDLKGLFDYNLKFRPEGAPSTASVTAPGGAQTAEPEVPSLYTAIEEELGLKLESTKGPLEVLVIDSIQRPSEN